MNLEDETQAQQQDAHDDSLDADQQAQQQDGGQSDEANASEEAGAFRFVDDEPTEDELAAQETPEWVHNLRNENRELKRQLRESEKPHQPQDAGPEPTLEDCGWDEDEFKAKWREWNAKATEQQRRADEVKREQQAQQEAWAKQVIAFEDKAKELRIPNFNDAVAEVSDHFGDDQAGNIAKAIIVKAGDPRLVAALRSSPAKMQQLVALKNDPTAFAIAIGELKGKIKTMPSRQAPPPENVQRGNSPTMDVGDKHLAALEKKAEQTGNWSEVFAYRRAQKRKGK